MSDAPFSDAPRYMTGSAASARGETSDRGRGEAAQIADNIIRQRLRVGDPNDPVEVARGLRRLFPEEAREIEADSAGLSLSSAVSCKISTRVESMATSAEMERADGAVGRDLRALSQDHRLGDIKEELFGWGQAIQGILAEGRSAAALALDPRARDRLFGARRQLNEYSRLARMAGAINPAIGTSYRQLANSLDEAASLMLVLAGETLAGQSLGGLRFLPSVSGSEIQSRRDNVLSGLRAIFDSSGARGDAEDFPWGMEGLRRFLKRIEESGHLDLRVLLDEATLGRHLDSLVELVARNDGPGLRALGATSEISTSRLHRLLAIGDEVPPAPGLTHFLKALQLFLDTFTSSQAGYRLLFVGRPVIAQRGGLGFGSMDIATARLMMLISQRAQLAGFADCLLACECDTDDILRQIRLDKILHDLDRAIDLYILGSDPNADGEAEWRAAAYGVLILANLGGGQLDEYVTSATWPPQKGSVGELLLDTAETLLKGKVDLASGLPNGSQNRIDAMVDELCQQSLSDARLEPVVRTMAPGCAPAGKVFYALEKMVTNAITVLKQTSGRAQQRKGRPQDCPAPEVKMPQTPAGSQASAARSLRIIRRCAFPAGGGSGGTGGGSVGTGGGGAVGTGGGAAGTTVAGATADPAMAPRPRFPYADSSYAEMGAPDARALPYAGENDPGSTMPFGRWWLALPEEYARRDTTPSTAPTYGGGARGYQTDGDRIEGYQSDGSGPAASGASREPTVGETGPASEEKGATNAASGEKTSSDAGPAEGEQGNARKRAAETEQDAKRKPASKS